MVILHILFSKKYFDLPGGGLHQVWACRLKSQLLTSENVNVVTSIRCTRRLVSRTLMSHPDHRLNSDHGHYVAPSHGTGSPMLLALSYQIFSTLFSKVKHHPSLVPLYMFLHGSWYPKFPIFHHQYFSHVGLFVLKFWVLSHRHTFSCSCSLSYKLRVDYTLVSGFYKKT